MTRLTSAKVNCWLTEPLPDEVAQAIDWLSQLDDVHQIAVMPDAHLAKDVCVGLVLATRARIYPAAVGSDIGCGMAAVCTTGTADLLADEQSAARMLAGLYQRVPALKHRRGTIRAGLPEALVQTPLSHARLEKLKARDGRLQLGSLGRGNHFLELQSDSDGKLWLMVHCGSRGIGQAISAHHAELAERAPAEKRLASFCADGAAGQAYLNDAQWAERYAAENRLAILSAAAGVLEDLFAVRLMDDSLIHTNHNHLRRELHGGVELWVHRKGALSAQPGEPGVIPGSMGTASFHTLGRGIPAALCSSSHGAGRALSRAAAVRTIGERQLLREMQTVWFDQRNADKLRDEAPSAYKDIFAVMRAQRELTKTVRQLTPVLNYKGT